MSRNLTTQAGLLAGSRAAGQILNALVTFIAARQLLQADFGTFRQIYLLFATLILVTDLGISESLYYFLPRHARQSARVVSLALKLVFCVQFVFIAVLFAFRGQIGASFGNADLAELMGIFTLLLFFAVCTRLWEVQLVAEQKVGTAALVTGGFESLRALAMIAVLWLSPDVRLLLWAMTAATAVKFAWFLAVLWREGRNPLEGASPGARDVLAYSLALWTPGVLNVLAQQGHQFLVGFWFTLEEFALYSVACFQVPLLGVLTSSVIEVMLVRLTAAHGAGDHDEVRRVWNAATQRSFAVFIPMAVGLAALAQPLLSLAFGDKYVGAAPLFVILLFNLPLNAIFANNVLRAFKAMRDYSKFYLARLILSLGLGVIGIVWFGMWGAALSSVLALYVITFWQLRTVARLLELPFQAILPWGAISRQVLAGVVAAIPAALCVRWLPQPLVALPVGAALFGAGYLLIGIWLNVVDPKQIL